MSRDRRRLFENLRPPAPPPELRRRTLAAARIAAAARADGDETSARPRRLITDRLWESRPLRLAWALLVIALLGANLALEAGRAVPAPAGGDDVASPPVSAEAWTLLTSRDVALQALAETEPDSADLPAPRVPRRSS